MRRALARLARAAPVRVFVAEGITPAGWVAQLRLDERVQLVDSPRSATVFLVAGDVPASLEAPLQRVHDAMATPRATVVWGGSHSALVNVVSPHARTIEGDVYDLVDALVTLQAELLSGIMPSDPPLLPDVEPAEWRGVGPYGQGGTGMTGGVPYGRPMAETAPDRDGLRLDRLDVRIGPFFPPFPTGLVLAVGLQGDVLQEVTVGENAFAGLPRARPDDPFRRALVEPVLLEELELARARHHLRWLAHALRVHGLAALGRRALALSDALTAGDVQPIAALRRRLGRTYALDAATAGVGVVERGWVQGRGLGPVARASGVAEDARTGDERYRALGFEPITHADCDARARWRQRLTEAEQSVTLAGRANDAMVDGSGLGGIESPRGFLTPTTSPLEGLLALVPQLLAGSEWGDAVTTIVSLDLDLRDVAPIAPVAASTGSGDRGGTAS